jgi:hypothetical protein
MTAWRGAPAPTGAIVAGQAGGGGTIQSATLAPPPGQAGCGGPGPGALIGLR